MEIKPIYEFLLWANCKNSCSFCWQKKNSIDKTLNLKGKRKSIELCIEEVKQIKSGHVLLVGGEIFDNTKGIEEELKNLFQVVMDAQSEGSVDLFYLNTNLIYKDLSLLGYIFNLALSKGILNRIRFTTSYDLTGRFKRNSDRILFSSNLSRIKCFFPNLPIVVNMILTEQVCSKILEEDSEILSWFNAFRVNAIPYIVLDEKLSPSRDRVFETLLKLDSLFPGYLKQYSDNFDLPQQKILREFNGNSYQDCSCQLSDCGHSVNFKKYSNAGTCFVCDIKELTNV